MNFRWVLKLLLLLTAIVVAIGLYIYHSPQAVGEFGTKTKYLVVRRGDNVFDIAYNLAQMKAIDSEINFIIFAKLPWNAKRLKAGRYAIEPGYSLAKIISMLRRGASVPYTITVPEGYGMKQIASLLSSQLEFGAEEFLHACQDRDLLDSLGLEGDNLEGYLFPATYDFLFDEPAPMVVRRMVKKFFAELPDSFEAKAQKLGLDFEEAVILASLIEKEAMLDSERPIISAVYHSRLKKGMLLQCDPTVIYALGIQNRPLYLSDLSYDSPYNTYRYPGLPPGPICSPGKASLLAAVNPAAVDFLYFVARGDGTHIFSRTNDEHNSAKSRVRRTKLIGLSP